MNTVARTRVLWVLVAAQLAGTSPWFAVNAVMPELQQRYDWPAADVGLLTSAVQFGFIAGTLVFAALAVSDRFSTRRVFLFCSIASAASSMLAAATDGAFTALWMARATTGFFLAGIYPVGMKIAAQWFPRGLGAALGLLVGALVLGSASSHALRALGVHWPWEQVLASVAMASAVGGLALYWAIPEITAPKVAPGALQWRALTSMWIDKRLRASVFGYFGHMWELYTMWVLVPAVLAARLVDTGALSWAAFAVLGAGALGCIGGGWLAGRFGSARVAAFQLGVSGLCCLLAPWAMAAPDAWFALWLLTWGVSVVGDSPQFSALTATNAPTAAVGSVLTLTNSIGFAISIVSILVFSEAAKHLPLPRILPWLGVGPLLGLLAMAPLLAATEKPLRRSS